MQDYTASVQAAKYIYETETINGIEVYVLDEQGNPKVKQDILDGNMPIVEFYHGVVEENVGRY